MVVDVVEKNTGPRGKDRSSSFAFTLEPIAKYSLTASMSPCSAVPQISLGGPPHPHHQQGCDD